MVDSITHAEPVVPRHQRRDMAGSKIDIVGAGPAGLAAAIVFARGGRKVTVHDRRASPGDRFHNDFQGLENWTGTQNILTELKSAGIASDFESHAVHKGTAFDDQGTAYTVESEEPIFYLVRRGRERGSLDQALASQAADLGVEVRFRDRVEDIEAPAVLAFGPRTADVIAVGYTFETDDQDGCWICFNDELAPLGYAYLLIANGRGTVANCMFTGFKNQRHHLERTVEFFKRKIGLIMLRSKPFGGYGNFRLPTTAVQGGKLVVGEQAGFQDSLAGFGMTYAFRSGIIAAQSILEKDANYAESWKEALLPLVRASIANRYLFNLAGVRGRRWVLANRICRGDVRLALRRLYRRWWAARLIYPLALQRYREPLRDKSCDHVDCSCIWCEHGLMPEEAHAHG